MKFIAELFDSRRCIKLKYKVKDYFMLREIVGDHVVLARGPAAIEFNGVLVLNEACVLLWKNMQNFKTTRELAEILKEEYSIDKEKALADVEKCVSKMMEYNLLDAKE